MKRLGAAACVVAGIVAHVQCVRAFAVVGDDMALGLGLLAASFLAAAFAGAVAMRDVSETSRGGPER